MIAIVGVGTLGARVLANLPKKSKILLIDHDIVREKNIPAQYSQEAVGMRKVDAAKKFIREDCEIVSKHLDYTTAGLLSESSLVIDCTDNMLTRLLINDYCKQQGIPLLHCALSDTAGVVAYFAPDGPCLRCVYGTNPGDTCTPELDLVVADRTAQVAVHEMLKHEREPQAASFIRVTSNSCVPYEITRDPHCLCCAGNYEYLTHTQPFYITYCVNASCMAAKPTRPDTHDHGRAKQFMVDGVSLNLYPNGEIHFLDEQDADVLQRIAQKVYATLVHNN